MTWSELVAPESQSMKSMENSRIIRLSRRITVSLFEVASSCSSKSYYPSNGLSVAHGLAGFP